MRLALIFSVVLVGVLVSPLVPTCEAQGWKELAIALAKKLGGLWRNDQLEFLGHQCNYSVKPTIRRFELYFKGRMWCPGWTSIRGEALTRSRSGVAGKTTKDFAKKVLQSGLITEEQAQAFINS